MCFVVNEFTNIFLEKNVHDYLYITIRKIDGLISSNCIDKIEIVDNIVTRINIPQNSAACKHNYVLLAK